VRVNVPERQVPVIGVVARDDVDIARLSAELGWRYSHDYDLEGWPDTRGLEALRGLDERGVAVALVLARHNANEDGVSFLAQFPTRCSKREACGGLALGRLYIRPIGDRGNPAG
jgi:hypothetical protein